MSGWDGKVCRYGRGGWDGEEAWEVESGLNDAIAFIKQATVLYTYFVTIVTTQEYNDWIY